MHTAGLGCTEKLDLAGVFVDEQHVFVCMCFMFAAVDRLLGITIFRTLARTIRAIDL